MMYTSCRVYMRRDTAPWIHHVKDRAKYFAAALSSFETMVLWSVKQYSPFDEYMRTIQFSEEIDASSR